MTLCTWLSMITLKSPVELNVEFLMNSLSLKK